MNSEPSKVEELERLLGQSRAAEARCHLELEATRERERQFRSIFEGASDAKVLADDQGSIVESNVAALSLLGAQLASVELSRLLPDGISWPAFLLAGLAHGEIKFTGADGRSRLLECRATARIITGRHLLVLRDVTEQKKLETHLALSDRMASVGTLAAGVAHEINNPLAALIANLNFMAEGLSEFAPRPELPAVRADWFKDQHESLSEATCAAERIRIVVRDLKLFSKPDVERRGPVDLNKVLDSTARMAWNEIRHRARLVKDYGRTLPVHASDSRLGQVFLNLMINAAQAIPEGNAEAHEIRLKTSMKAGQVVTEITDTGCGIAPGLIGRLFEPFFTTKPVGVGTGLGLSICDRIVHEFGGTIEVQSAPGQGTTFRVTLPASREEAAPQATPASVKPQVARRGRVLVVDDDPMIGKTVARVLRPDHDVTVVVSAVIALEFIRAGALYDIILCDLMMPQMSGMGFHEALAKVQPRTANSVIFFTGGVFTPGAASFLERVPNQRLEKPFDPARLRALVNEQLRATQ